PPEVFHVNVFQPVHESIPHRFQGMEKLTQDPTLSTPECTHGEQTTAVAIGNETPELGPEALCLGGGAGVDLVRLRQLPLAGPGKVDANTRAARAAQLPSGGIQLCALREVTGLHRPPAVGERERLLPGAREAEPDLSPGLQ